MQKGDTSPRREYRRHQHVGADRCLTRRDPLWLLSNGTTRDTYTEKVRILRLAACVYDNR
jgi:hypothetical protein